MKELSIEEKALRYDEVIERANSLLSGNQLGNDWVYALLPELKESEDERIRKWLIEMVKELRKANPTNADHNGNCSEAIAWLEKQGSQDNDEDVDILYRFSFYSYKDEPNVIYLSGLYVNEEYRNKGIGTKILEVTDEVAKSLNCHAIRLKTKKDSDAERLYQTHGYNNLSTEEKDDIWLEKKGEQNPAWSEEDEKMLESFLHKLEVCDLLSNKENVWAVRKLKSLRPQSQWKPSDEQMHALNIAMQGVNDPLFLLYQDLKKLK